MYEIVGATEWQPISVFDLAKWKNGLAFKNIQFSSSGDPVIKIAELKAGVTDQTKLTNGDYGEDVRVRKGDMLFSWSGNPDTSIDVFEWEGPPGWLNQHIYKITPKDEIDRNFLFFLLKWLKPRFAEIARNKQTTGLGHVTLADFKQMQIGLPDLYEQAAIVALIKPYHDKIALNRRMNETLEGLARALFKDWFVDFGPTRAKASGAKPDLPPEIWSLFPDRLDDNGVPEGWEEKCVRDILELSYGKSMPAKKRIAGEIPVYGSGGITGAHNEALVKKPTIIVGRKGTVGSLYWQPTPCFPIDTVFYVKTDKSLVFCYYLLQTLGLNTMNTDAAVPGLNRDNAYRLPVMWANKPVRDAFDSLVIPLRERIDANNRESRTLAQTRDLLLPKLMSGALRVGAAEEIVEGAL